MTVTARRRTACANRARSAGFSGHSSGKPFSASMKRHELEHILHAASAVTNHADIVVIGSQALLGQFPDAPAQLLISMEAGPDLEVESWRSFGCADCNS